MGRCIHSDPTVVLCLAALGRIVLVLSLVGFLVLGILIILILAVLVALVLLILHLKLTSLPEIVCRLREK